MSYSIKEAQLEQANAIVQAVEQDDDETLFRIARQLKAKGDDEFAEYVRSLAQSVDDNNWAHDRNNDNSL